jgi:Ca2+-dependent lipid-binding protein
LKLSSDFLASSLCFYRSNSYRYNAAQFVIIVTVLCFSPLLVDLARVVLLGQSFAVSAAGWLLASAAVCGSGVAFFKITRRPFTRWLLRVACAVGVNAKEADIVVAGVAGLTGAAGCLLTYTASVAIQWLLVGRGWGTFLLSLFLATASVVFHEHRITERAKLKRALTVYYDAEKNAEGLHALMGKSAEVNKSEVSFAVTTPQWIRYQDAELVNWLNVFLARTWPFYNRALCSTIRAAVEPLLEEHRPSLLSKMYFDALDLGPEPIQMRYVKFVGSKSDAMGVSLEFDLAWAGRSKIMLNAKTTLGNTLAIGVKDVEVYAKVQVTLQPLMPSLCPFGGLMVTLTEKPLFEFDLELPLGLEGTVSNALQDWLETFLSDTLGEALVWPERIVVPLAKDDDPIRLPSGETVTHKWYHDNVLKLRNTGIVCVTAKRAANVPSADLLSKSDAYMRLHIKGPTKCKTEVLMNDNDPEWNESLYLLVDDVNARKLTLQIMDDDGDLGSDDVIGETKLSLADLLPNETKDVWLEFPETAKRNAKSKKPPMTANVDITYIPFDVGGGGGDSSLAGIGMLTCRLIRGTGLKAADYNGFSDPFCKVSMQKAVLSKAEKKKNKADVIKYKSKVIKKTLDPEWNEMYDFVGVRKSSDLVVECFDRDVGYVANSKDTLGSFKVSITDLFGSEGGSNEIEKEFELGGDKTIKAGLTV